MVNRTYAPLVPHKFYMYEPKKRAIEAAVVRDRVVHHALYRVIEPIFDRRLIYDTYACRLRCCISCLARRTLLYLVYYY